MDFNELLTVADSNKNEAFAGTAIKRFSSQLPPPKKVTKSGVQSEGIRKFLEKKKAEEAAKAAEARKQKEQLLAIRAQNSKNNKKAKIMASRTKDNDFSKIRLTDEEIEAKKKREAELLRKNLDDKVERMKARIEMEEKEALLPRKRRRKNKNGEYIEHRVPEEKRPRRDNYDPVKEEKNALEKKSHTKIISKPPPPPPVMNFNDLLKIAEKKKNEPLEIIVPKKVDEKLLSKKERKLYEEEKMRERRKQERLLQGDLSVLNKKPPVVIRVERDIPKQAQDSSRNKLPKSTPNIPSSKNGHIKQLNVKAKSEYSNNKPSCSLPEKHVKPKPLPEQRKLDKSKDERTGPVKSNVQQKKSSVKINPVSYVPTPAPQIDTDALSAAIEKRIREKIEKEMEERLAAKFAAKYGLNSSDSAPPKAKEVPKQNVVKKEIVNTGIKKPAEKFSREDIERIMALKKRSMEQKKPAPKVPEKKPFHKNPYLDPPRRLLEPQIRRPPPSKRRIESSDEEEDDDDMSDFIDDGPSTQNEDNYSEYIKEIFGYDKNKYLDCDDDDIMESSFAQQMKEEMESARAGAREDLEEERKEIERKKRKKLKK